MRYLVVANQTLVGDHLLERVRECVAQGACSFHLVVPASTHGDDGHELTHGQAHARAQRRLDEALARFRAVGAEVTGEVGDHRPLDAVKDAMYGREVDEVILSTLPPGLSRWLRQDLPHRITRHVLVPVTHLVGDGERAPA